MGLSKQRLEEEEQQEQQYIPCLLLKLTFHLISCTVLSLLLPLSFLLLARVTTFSIPCISPFRTVITFLYADLPVFHALVSFVCFAALIYALTGHLYRPPVGVAWVFLCLFQVCVTFGVEATLAAGFRPTTATGVIVNGGHALWLKHAVLYVGVYKTMRICGRMIVKPVVDSTLGVTESRRWRRTEKVVLSVAFTALWVRMLQHEVAPMVFAAIEGGLRYGMAWDAYVRWLISHTTVMTGIVRIIQGLVCLGKFLLLGCKKKEDEEHQLPSCCASAEDDQV